MYVLLEIILSRIKGAEGSDGLNSVAQKALEKMIVKSKHTGHLWRKTAAINQPIQKIRDILALWK